ncbi:MAG: hypothetical protein CMI08_12080 [Oceanospirillaceae bacterium]|uniref:alpha/beta hydrolase n=1 Tax=unclassified Thalassolituus TaxID=2624967 RepID=UPI000C4A8EF6|nr:MULTISPECIES: alpha/beta fold hydrolase [unclassified Thalassolituus]MAS25283.1 hypothetical protein [Oceanospirillaceae bacterium]MAX99915.1 hypothetical protein [Oceanospirillaceae bacterium]MBL34798.1 hypothetical protein [Oceanospirillaceae bacterium]MBS53418.1 hypothetical protein [Oceanospirillaceae bacterium]|tara:strand:- start:588 stop:1442 length:855 start_codon:yes stop_codon:yes gene_type:complete
MDKHPLNLTTASAIQHALVIQKPRLRTDGELRRLVLLHGAGVAGEVTWMYLVNYLEEWDEILIPDFAGMGKSRFLDNGEPVVNDYARQIQELLIRINWSRVDIAGYSFGGMVTHALAETGQPVNNVYLLEPAMLFSGDKTELNAKAGTYADISAAILSGNADDNTFLKFLDSVSPARPANSAVDQMTINRLKENRDGFALSLNAVSVEIMQRADYFLSWQAPWSGVSFVGGLTPAYMHERHQQLAETSSDWRYESVAGADHSLVFTKPRTIARAMNAHRATRGS